MRTLLLFVFLSFLGGGASAIQAQGLSVRDSFKLPDGYKPEFRRERNHELIKTEQRLVMSSDGRADELFTPSEDSALNTALTFSLSSEVNRLAYQIETDFTLDHRLKVNYLFGLESLLRYFRVHWTQAAPSGVNPYYLSLLITNYEGRGKLS